MTSLTSCLFCGIASRGNVCGPCSILLRDDQISQLLDHFHVAADTRNECQQLARLNSVSVRQFPEPSSNRPWSSMSITGSLSTDEDRDRARRAKDAERKRRQRSSDKKRQYEREADKNRKAESRSRQTEVEREASRAAKRQQMAESRSRQTEVEREASRAASQQQMAESRSRQTKEQKEKNQKRDSSTRAIRNAEVKQTKSVPLSWPSGIPYDVKRSCYGNFLEMTSMSSLAESPCAICNMRVVVKDMELIPQQQLQDVCPECRTALSKDKIPKFSPANNIWIGDVPEELKDLTIPEEKLISLYTHNRSWPNEPNFDGSQTKSAKSFGMAYQTQSPVSKLRENRLRQDRHTSRQRYT
ncbi:unnamed protein product [Didymodactylos carnosus]|uniref:DUF6570 domain-containing protein n=1 Tax=Didymodactylos carnosus TaxID=1234261 RepID=A0A8S2XEE9_9BILA|nr:unnamed protein product [Didymodactylos carnosus]